MSGVYDNLSALLAIAEAAQQRSPGPWRRLKWNKQVFDDGQYDWMYDSSPMPAEWLEHSDAEEWRGNRVLETDGGYYEPKGITGRYIEAMSPDVVLKLINVARAAWGLMEGTDRLDEECAWDSRLIAALEELEK